MIRIIALDHDPSRRKPSERMNMIYLKKGRACLAPITGSHLSEHALGVALLILGGCTGVIDRCTKGLDPIPASYGSRP